MRLRDRKSVLAAIVLSVAYVCVALTALLMLAERAELFRPAAIDPMLVKLLAANAVFLLWRIIVRAYFVWRIEGWRQALLSIPRTLIANIISIIAARRAVTGYVGHLLGKALNWDKTNHSHFPNVKSTTR
jgi:adsorption protein B